jgi:hypothetical protein
MFSANVHAAPIMITLDTSSLSGTQTLILGLTNFDASSNTVLLSDFAFGGGSAVGGSADCTLGGVFGGSGCSGDLTSGVTLEDLDPTAALFSQQFEAGATLSFVLNATDSFTGPVPDQFSMFACDTALTCYSDDASGALLLLDLVSPLSPASFVLFEASSKGLPAPVVSVTSPVPEPGTLWMLAAGVAAAASRRHRRRSRQATERG